MPHWKSEASVAFLVCPAGPGGIFRYPGALLSRQRLRPRPSAGRARPPCPLLFRRVLALLHVARGDIHDPLCKLVRVAGAFLWGVGHDGSIGKGRAGSECSYFKLTHYHRVLSLGGRSPYTYGVGLGTIVISTDPIGSAHKLLSWHYKDARLPLAALGHAAASADILGDACPECYELAGWLHLYLGRGEQPTDTVIGDGEIVDEPMSVQNGETIHPVARDLSSRAPQVHPDPVLGCAMLSTAVELGRAEALEMVRGLCR